MLFNEQKKCSLKILMMTKIYTLMVLTLFLSSCSAKKVIYVTGSSFVNCEGVLKHEPLHIKENIEDKWIVLHDTIESFEYKEGYTYKIEVKTTKIKNQPADGTALKYELVKVIYQEKSKEIVNLNGKWKVSKLIGIDSLKKSPTLNIDTTTKKISGNGGCNSYGSSFTIEGNQIKVTTPFATKMYCTNMNIEKAFFNCLQNISSYKFVKGTLTLFSKDGEEQLVCTKVEE